MFSAAFLKEEGIGVYQKTQNRRKSSKTAKLKKKNHIPLTKTLIDPLQSVTSGAYISFAAIRDRWRRKIAAQIDEKPEPKEQKPKTTSDTKPENPLVFFTNTENRRLKNVKSANCNEHQNRKTEKTDLKK